VAGARVHAGGELKKLSVRGDVADSLIAAGLVSGPGTEFDLSWCCSTAAFLDGSWIGKVQIRGSLTSSATEGVPFGVGAWEVRRARVGGASDHPLVLSEV
jgi:hypothetical protein